MASEHVSLRDFVERIFEERQAALELAFKAQQEALGLASRTLELRLEKLNELRQEVTQDRGNYVTKDKYDADLKAVNQYIDRLEGSLAVWRFLSVGGGFAALLEVGRLAGWIK